MSKKFKDIRQRIIKQLGELFPFIVGKPDVRKSSSMQPLYKVIPCPPLPPKLFKQALDNITSNSFKQQDSSSHKNITSVQQTLKRAQQYFTGCINILQHNEKVRQKYEVNLINGQNTMQREMKQIGELIRTCGGVKSKGELGRLIRQKGGKMMEIGYKEQQQTDKRLSSRSVKCQQPAQFYLPVHPDQFSFITPISQAQYLVLHQQVLQKLLVHLTTVSTINQQLSLKNHNNNPILQSTRQILSSLASDEMFCVQDNMFNRLVRFILEYVHGVVRDKEARIVDLQRRRCQLRQSLLRVYYLQFMVRDELEIICEHLRAMVETNKRFLLQSSSSSQSHHIHLNIKSISTQFQQTSHLKQSLNNIFQYLTDNEQQIFPLLYKRKLKKFIVKYQQTEKLIMLAGKINKSIIKMSKRDGLLFEGHSSEKQLGQENLNRNNNSILTQLQSLITTTSNISQNINTSFPSSLSDSTSSSLNDRQFDQLTSLFSKMYRQLQRLQLRLSQIQHKVYRQQQTSSIQLSYDNSMMVSSKIRSAKRRILFIEAVMIDRFKMVIRMNNDRGLTLKDYLHVCGGKVFAIDDDSRSNFSGISSSSSSSISVKFQSTLIHQSDVILFQPAFTNQSYIQPPSTLQQLIKIVDDFVTNQLVKNQLLFEQLQDAKNINFQMLNCLIYHVDSRIKDVLGQSKIKKMEQSLSPKKQREMDREQSTQENTQKAKISRDNRFRKSPKKGQPLNASPSKQKQSLNKQQSTIYQTLENLKGKLIFIRQILCPQISQCRISRIFSQTPLHTEIFHKVCSIISVYKEKIFTEQVYQGANRYKLRNFLQQRVSFLNTVLKNHKQLLQIFNFIKFLSQQKVKFQLTDQKTFQIILRALLASKQIQAYRRENMDLCKLGKLSSHGVRMLEEEVYIPFMLMFKSLLRIVSSEESTVKVLENMLESIKVTLQITDSIKQLFAIEVEDKLVKQIKSLIDSIIEIKQFAIFKYTKIQSIAKILRLSLSLQTKSQNQQRKSVILTYLKIRLMQREDGSSNQPLLG